MIFTKTKINEGFTKITFNNPPINLFDAAASIELGRLMDELEADESLKVVVFESNNPDYFMAHAELLHLEAYPQGVGKTGLSLSWPDIGKRLEQASFVSIASIRGRARGLGSEFIQALDMRFASKEKAFFGQPEIGIGAFPGGGGMERLHLLTGKARALEIILSGDDYNAETAAAYGWVNRAIADTDLDAFVENMALRIASFDKKVITEIKSIINERVVNPTNEQIIDSQMRFFSALSSPEAAIRLKRLFEKGLQQDGELELNFGKYL